MAWQLVELVLLTVVAIALGAVLASPVGRSADDHPDGEEAAGPVPHECPAAQVQVPYYYPWLRPTAAPDVADPPGIRDTGP
ncbi:hypothetical protein [Kitasatospora sp. NBC_00315]|uniref:hypothetical protein n=1 Tax=Kitasatospora sp. NBC_00315 TaxID=2975963 RepID=UPI003243DFBC